MDTVVQSPNVQVPSLNSLEPVVQAGHVALKFLENTGQERKNQVFKIARAMAKSAVEKGSVLGDIDFESVALKDLVAPQNGKQASGWLSPLWKQLEVEQKLWQEGMSATAVELGAAFVPRFKKLDGSPAKYLFFAEALAPASQGEPSVEVSPGGLRYTPAAVAAPGSALNAGLRSGVLRHSVAFVLMAGVLITVLTALVLLSLWWLVNNGFRLNTVPTVAHLCIVLTWGLFAWAIYRLFCFFADLGDLGIVMAPEILVPFSEDHVTLELRPRNSERRGEFAFVRYTGVCSRCSGKVMLHSGGAEFPGRIVGRCRESPREHVFSFDQKLHVGVPLRAIPC